MELIKIHLGEDSTIKYDKHNKVQSSKVIQTTNHWIRNFDKVISFANNNLYTNTYPTTVSTCSVDVQSGGQQSFTDSSAVVQSVGGPPSFPALFGTEGMEGEGTTKRSTFEKCKEKYDNINKNILANIAKKETQKKTFEQTQKEYREANKQIITQLKTGIGIGREVEGTDKGGQSKETTNTNTTVQLTIGRGENTVSGMAGEPRFLDLRTPNTLQPGDGRQQKKRRKRKR